MEQREDPSKRALVQIPAHLNRISRVVINSVFSVHSTLGPGLLESVYEVCLAREFELAGLNFLRQVPLPVVYKDVQLDAGFRLDFLVEDQIVLEIKAIDGVLPVHEAQLLTYLKLSGRHLGFLIDFKVPLIKQGIRRMVL